MGTDGRDDGGPGGGIEHDEPIAELQELSVETSEDFTSRLRRRIERKEFANHFVWVLWHLPAMVLLELLDFAFGLLANSNRGDGGGTP